MNDPYAKKKDRFWAAAASCYSSDWLRSQSMMADALRNAYADGLLEGVRIGGISPQLAAARRANKIRRGGLGYA